VETWLDQSGLLDRARTFSPTLIVANPVGASQPRSLTSTGHTLYNVSKYEYLFRYLLIKVVTMSEGLDEGTATYLAELFRALSDTSRVRIVSALVQGEMNVSSLADAVGISESAVSHHLRGLRQMRLVRGRKDGRQVFYSLDDDHIEALFRLGLDHVQHG
jgi:DNA-binding transcriptional ArsR family regulator